MKTIFAIILGLFIASILWFGTIKVVCPRQQITFEHNYTQMLEECRTGGGTMIIGDYICMPHSWNEEAVTLYKRR